MRPKRPQRVFERLRRVREIHNDQVRLSLVHPLHPAWHGASLGRRLHHMNSHPLARVIPGEQWAIKLG